MRPARLLTGLALIAFAAAGITSPATAQSRDFAEGAVTIDLGAIPGGGGAYGGYNPGLPAESYGVAPPSGGLLLPGRSTPHSTIYVQPDAKPSARRMAVTRAEPDTGMPHLKPPAAKAKPKAKTKPKPAAKPEPAMEAPSVLQAPPPPPPSAMKMAEAPPAAPAPLTPGKKDTKSAEAPAPSAPPPPPPVTTTSAAPPPPPPPPPAATPVPTPPEAKATSTASLTPGGDGRLLRVLFDEGQSKLPDSAKANLQKLADEVKDKSDVRLQLLAYAGGGDLKSNRARRLSLSRALSVRSFLIEAGIRSTRIDVRALGDKTPDEPMNRVDIALAQR